jgi:2-iminobutanoate/2-iminopropanoate deaminase
MDKRIIQPNGMAEAAGPFSRAVLIGNHLHIAGTTTLSHVSGDYYDRSVPGTIEEQTRLTLDNIQKCVEVAGGNMGDIFKVVIVLKTPEDYKRMNAIRAEYFPREIRRSALVSAPKSCGTTFSSRSRRSPSFRTPV